MNKYGILLVAIVVIGALVIGYHLGEGEVSSFLIQADGTEQPLAYIPTEISEQVSVDCFPGEGEEIVLISPTGEEYQCIFDEDFFLMPTKGWKAYVKRIGE